MLKLRVPTKFDYFGSNGMSNQQMFAKIISTVNFVGKIVGMDIFSENYSPFTFVFATTLCHLFGHLFLELHNFYFYGNDLVRFCFLMVTTICATQAVAMVQIFVIQREKIIELTRRIKVFLDKCKTKKSREIFEKWIIMTCHGTIFLGVVVTTSAVVMFIYPIGYYFLFGEKILHFGFQLPWFEWQSTLGYTMNFIYCGIVIYMFAIGLFITVFPTIFTIVMSFGKFELIKMFIDELNELIAGNRKGQNDTRIKKIIVEIIDNHTELLELLTYFENTFKIYYLVQIGCSVFLDTVTLYAISVAKFYSGYFIMIDASCQFFTPCLIGNLLSIEGDKYHSNLCNVNWYDLPQSERKMFSLIIQVSLFPKKLTLLVAELNFRTFTEICKLIYSFFMLLQSFKD